MASQNKPGAELGSAGFQSGILSKFTEKVLYTSYPPTSLNDIASGETIFTNGANNAFADAVRNGTSQVAQLDGTASNFILNFNPSSGLPADLLQSLGDISGTYVGVGHTALAQDLARTVDALSKRGITGIRLIGHSQGGAITTSAIRFASDSGFNLASIGRVELNHTPINDIYARGRLARRTGLSNRIGTRAQFGDAVHGVVGFNFISNPLRLPFSILRSPQLFSRDATVSPHSLPCVGGRSAACL